MNKNGILTLIPTPLCNGLPLGSIAHSMLEQASNNETSKILVEEHKECRRRWLSWGLPRESIDDFILYNEHNSLKSNDELIGFLKKGYNLFLLSDCGLPAFCDPGRSLVSRCHDDDIIVTSAPFENSIVLALALSGFDHDCFKFYGFPPVEKDLRRAKLEEILKTRETSIIMDTPYRLTRLLTELRDLSMVENIKKRAFLATGLNCETECLSRSTLGQLLSRFEGQKLEFILILEGQS